MRSSGRVVAIRAVTSLITSRRSVRWWSRQICSMASPSSRGNPDGMRSARSPPGSRPPSRRNCPSGAACSPRAARSRTGGRPRHPGGGASTGRRRILRPASPRRARSHPSRAEPRRVPAVIKSGAPRPGKKQSPPAVAPHRVTRRLSARAKPTSGDEARPRVASRSGNTPRIFMGGQSGGAAENPMARSHQAAAPSRRASARRPPTS